MSLVETIQTYSPSTGSQYVYNNNGLFCTSYDSNYNYPFYFKFNIEDGYWECIKEEYYRRKIVTINNIDYCFYDSGSLLYINTAEKSLNTVSDGFSNVVWIEKLDNSSICVISGSYTKEVYICSFDETGTSIYSKTLLYSTDSLNGDLSAHLDNGILYMCNIGGKFIIYDLNKKEVLLEVDTNKEFNRWFGIHKEIIYHVELTDDLYVLYATYAKKPDLSEEIAKIPTANDYFFYKEYLYGYSDNVLYKINLVNVEETVIEDNNNAIESGGEPQRIFYITKDGEGCYGGGINVNNKFIVDSEGNVTLPQGTTISWSDIGDTDNIVTSDQLTSMQNTIMTEIGDTYVKTNEIEANIATLGGWSIGENGLKSKDFDEVTNTNGIRLDKNGEIRSKGSWYSSGDEDVEGWFARLCSGKWIFGYYDSTQADPFIPPEGTPYSDISVNGVYVCSKDTILNKVSQYLFAVDATEDTVKITNSSKTSPALTITNNYYEENSTNATYDAPALVLHSPKEGYRNRPFDAKMKVTGKTLGTEQEVDEEYCIAMFGEEENGRITLRSDTETVVENDDGTTYTKRIGNKENTESSTPVVPSTIGTTTFRWYQGYFMELYSTNGLNTSSDKKIKNHIDYLSPEESLNFCNKLQPVEYTLKNNANKRIHRGFYAQDVKQVADDMEIGNLSLYSAIWNKDGQELYYSEDAPDEELHWSLNYNEFIAPLVGAVQALTKKVNALEKEIEELKSNKTE